MNVAGIAVIGEMEQLVAVSVPVAIMVTNTVAIPGTWTERLLGSTDATSAVEMSATYTDLAVPTFGTTTFTMKPSLRPDSELVPMAYCGRSPTVRPPGSVSPWAMILTTGPPVAET